MVKTSYAISQLKIAIRLAFSSTLFIVYCDAQATPAYPDTESREVDSAPSIYLDTIVVTATRSEKSLKDAPVTLQVLDKETLVDNHAQTLKEALQLLPNVNLVQLHGKTGYEVRMQGFSGDQVLVLIDGLPVSASTGSTVNLNQYLNTNVEQIEVIQGAASAQYGSSAMGGVINVITKPITSSNASITAEFGSNGSQNPSDNSFDNNRSFIEASVEGYLSEDGRVKARLSGSYLDEQGLSIDNDDWPLLKDPSEQKQISAKVTYIPNVDEVKQRNPRNQYWMEASLYEETDVSRFNYYVPPRYLRQQRDEDISRQRFSIGAKKEFNNKSTASTEAYKISGSAMYENYDSHSNTISGNTLTSAREAKIETLLGQAQLDLPIIYSGETQSHAVQVGTKWQQDKLKQTKNKVSELKGNDVDRDVIEAYIQDDWMLGDEMEILIGARYQNDSDFGDHFAPKLALRKDIRDGSQRLHIFRASVGKGYRVPNLKERYYVFDHSNLGYKVLGNAELSPETSVSYQLGYQTNLNDDVSLSVNGFYNEISDLIQTDNNNPVYNGTIAIYSYDNIDEATTYGGDATVNWHINDKTALKLAYAYLQTNNEVTGSDLTYSPEHKITANLEYQLSDKLQLIQQVRYESEQLVNTSTQSYSPSWWGLDSRANYSATSNLDVYLSVNNLLDEQREAANANDQRPVDNRQWIVGASYHW